MKMPPIGKLLFASALAVCLFLAISDQSYAQFTVTDAGPIDSAGAVGDPDNDTIFATYGGPTSIFSTLDFSGDLTEVIAATFASEADFEIRNTTAGTVNDYDPTTTDGFTGTITITDTVGGLFWIDAGDSYEFESYESLDDGAGADAFWTDVSFEFGVAPTISSIGSFGPNGGTFTFDTEGSAFDTEIALFNLDGTLIGTDDDGGSGTLSSISETLAFGDYLAVVGGFNSLFFDRWATAGTAGGAFDLNVDGSLVASGTLAAGEFGVFGFTVVPEPASACLIALCAIGLVSSRRRRLN